MDRKERGAVAIITAISLLFVIVAVAMAVDIGDVVWRKRQVQGVVDLASLDAVQALGDRRDSSQTRCQQTLAYAQQSANRNDFDYSPPHTLTIQLGTMDPNTKVFTSLTDCYNVLDDPSSASAVMVMASRPVLFEFMPGSDTVTASAVSALDSQAQIGMGTSRARAQTSDTTLYDAMMGCMAQGGGNC